MLSTVQFALGEHNTFEWPEVDFFGDGVAGLIDVLSL